MNITRTALSCLLLAAALPSFAGVIVNFDSEAAANPTSMIDASTLTYDGGAVQILGSGAAFVTASSTAVSGGLGNFYGSVASSSDHTSNKGALALEASSFRAYVATGFNGPFSVDFAGEGNAHLVALDKNMNVIATFGAASENNNGCDTGFACNWSTLSFDFGAGVDVYAVDVVGASGLQWFDNLSFDNINASTTTNGLPEPSTAALGLAALAALYCARQRNSRTSGRV